VDGTPFVLSGYAGTGKTFLSMRFLAQVEATGLCWTVVAPTHKAVGVLRSHLALAGLSPTWYPLHHPPAAAPQAQAPARHRAL
jgi:exodeoxyribonuclease V